MGTTRFQVRTFTLPESDAGSGVLVVDAGDGPVSLGYPEAVVLDPSVRVDGAYKIDTKQMEDGRHKAVLGFVEQTEIQFWHLSDDGTPSEKTTYLVSGEQQPAAVAGLPFMGVAGEVLVEVDDSPAKKDDSAQPETEAAPEVPSADAPPEVSGEAEAEESEHPEPADIDSE